MYQWHRRILRALDYDAGIVGDNTLNQRSITVTTYDSAYIHMPMMGTLFGLVVFDEVHHLPGKCRREAALLCAAPLRLGLTATPERSDGRHEDLAQLIGPTVFRMSVAEAKGRTLADYNVVRVPVALLPEEQARYDEASREVRLFMLAKQKEQRAAPARTSSGCTPASASSSSPARTRWPGTSRCASWSRRALERERTGDSIQDAR